MIKCILCSKAQCSYFYYHPLFDTKYEHLRSLCDQCNLYYINMQRDFEPKPMSKKDYLKYIELQVFK